MDRFTRVVVRERNPTFMNVHSDYIHNFDHIYSDSYTSTTVYMAINSIAHAYTVMLNSQNV